MSLAGSPEDESKNTPIQGDTEKSVEENSPTADLVEDEFFGISRRNKAVEAEQRRISRRPKLAVGAIALAVLIGGGATVFAASNSKPQIPEAMKTVSAGSNNTEICESFIKTSIGCDVTWLPNATEKRGALLGQSISAGSRVDKDTKVVLTYSSGPATSEMPNLKNKTVAEAETALYEMNVSVSEIKEIPGADIPKGNVISSSVAAGTKVENGSSVILSVSNGKAGVPNWSDKTKEFVETDAKKLGLEVNFVYEESEKASDLVLSQTPAAGEVSSEDKVKVVLSKSFASKDIKVPDVIGKAAVSAQAELAAAGFRHIKTVTVTNSEVTSTQVTQVVPGVGQIGKSEENLVIIVSNPSK